MCFGSLHQNNVLPLLIRPHFKYSGKALLSKQRFFCSDIPRGDWLHAMSFTLPEPSPKHQFSQLIFVPSKKHLPAYFLWNLKEIVCSMPYYLFPIWQLCLVFLVHFSTAASVFHRSHRCTKVFIKRLVITDSKELYMLDFHVPVFLGTRILWRSHTCEKCIFGHSLYNWPSVCLCLSAATTCLSVSFWF